jgi:hypothetical protein
MRRFCCDAAGYFFEKVERDDRRSGGQTFSGSLLKHSPKLGCLDNEHDKVGINLSFLDTKLNCRSIPWVSAQANSTNWVLEWSKFDDF